MQNVTYHGDFVVEAGTLAANCHGLVDIVVSVLLLGYGATTHLLLVLLVERSRIILANAGRLLADLHLNVSKSLALHLAKLVRTRRHHVAELRVLVWRRNLGLLLHQRLKKAWNIALLDRDYFVAEVEAGLVVHLVASHAGANFALAANARQFIAQSIQGHVAYSQVTEQFFLLGGVHAVEGASNRHLILRHRRSPAIFTTSGIFRRALGRNGARLARIHQLDAADGQIVADHVQRGHLGIVIELALVDHLERRVHGAEGIVAIHSQGRVPTTILWIDSAVDRLIQELHVSEVEGATQAR